MRFKSTSRIGRNPLNQFCSFMDGNGGNPFNDSSNSELNNSQNNFTAFPQNAPFTFPQNFDFNSLPPAEREILLRRLQQQQAQQQQAQLQRAFQAQAQTQSTQNINFQRMTMNAYTTPRPPLNTSPQSQIQPQAFINPTPQIPFNNFNPNQMMSRPVFPSGINPALLQQQQQQSTGIKQINPQQFTNPLQASLKSDPLLYSAATLSTSEINHIPANSGFNATSLNLAPFDEQVMSSEGNFIDHLIKFLDAIKFINRAIPQIANRPISLFRLFQVVNSAGGFVAVGETKKWPLVTQALQLPAQSYEVVSLLRATYYTFLYTYEQYFVQKKPLDKIDWPNKLSASTSGTQTTLSQNIQRQSSLSSQPTQSSQLTQHAQPTQASMSQANTPSIQSSQSQSQTPIHQFPVQTLKHIPESELALWKPFADVMKVPIGPICDIDTAILYMNSPFFTLKIEALLATQKLFAHSSPKELQIAGITIESLENLLDSLEGLWKESVSSVPLRIEKNKTMETFWAQVDRKIRDIFNQEDDKTSDSRSLAICRQIVSLIRTLTVTKGPDVAQFLAKSHFIKSSLLPFGLMQADDWELYKDSLIVLESIGAHLGTIEPDLLEWIVLQCTQELRQVRNERLTALASKFTGTLNLDRISSFENISAARQSVSVLITQSAQLWKSVPAHIFLHLSSCLSVLTSCDSITFDLDEFVSEIEMFMDIFVLPTVSLLRSVRALYECQGCSMEEIRRILETVIYSPSFSLTDGGFLELCLQILLKCHPHMDSMNWTGVIILLRELREFWRHGDNGCVSNLGKSCYQSGNVVSGSPAKPNRSSSSNSSKVSLAILNGATSITAVFSHPFLLLCKSLNLFALNFQNLPDAFKLDLLELALEWNLDTPSKWGREILASDKFDESLNIIREFYE